MGVLRFAVKSTIAGSLVYLTIREGVWSEQEESVKLYGRVYNKIAPLVKENVPKEILNEIPDLPSTTDVTDLVRNSWNKGVLVSMKFISQLPCHTKNGINSILEIPAIKEAFSGVKNAPEVVSKTQ